MRRETRNVIETEPVGPYTLLRVERGEIEPGSPGQFFMLGAPGRLLPRPMSLALAAGNELGFLIDPIGPGTRALCSLEPGDRIAILGPLGNGFRLDVERPLQPRRQHAARLRRADRRLSHSRGGARRTRSVHHDAVRCGRRRACDRKRAKRRVDVASGTDR